MKRSLRACFFVALLGFSFSNHAEDNDPELAGRIGLGFTNLGPGYNEALSVDWQATHATSFEFNLAVDTKPNNNYLQPGIIAHRNLFIEKEQVYFLFIGGSLISHQVNGLNHNGYGIDSGIGARFFLEGLPNLGLSFKAGLQLASTTEVRFRTGVNFGIHYYF